MKFRGILYEHGYCDCGRTAHKKKGGEWVCAQCDQIERWLHIKIVHENQTSEQERNRVNRNVQDLRQLRLNSVTLTFDAHEPGPNGILIEGNGRYAL